MSVIKRGRIDRTALPLDTSILTGEQLQEIAGRNESPDVATLLKHIEELEDEIIIRNRVLLDHMYLDSFENIIRAHKRIAELEGGCPEDVEATANHLSEVFAIKRASIPND